MKKIVLFGVAVGALVLGANMAYAADPALPPSWSGFYGGVELGYASVGGQINDYNPNYQDNVNEDSSNGNNLLLGGKLGYDFDTGSNFVLGVSADVKALFGEDSECTGDCGTDANGMSHLAFGVKGLGALDARAGFLISPSSLLYVEGGLAAGEVVTHHRDNDEYDGSSHLLTGWNVGVGFEQMVSENVSLVLNGRYYDLGKIDTNSSGEDFGYEPRIFTVSTGFNIRF